ncbi:MAG: RNA polymerase sigma factor [Sphingomicrobium sp.]
MDQPTTIFAEWMRAHIGVLHRISRAFAHSADQHDLMQELMLAMWKAAPAFRGGSAPSTFIYRVSLNRALTWRRSETKRNRRAAEADAQWHSIANEPADQAEAELLDRLYGAIRQLRLVDRALILMALDGVPHREIGRIHGFTETNVAVRLNRARQQISILMKEQDDEL